MSYSFNVRAASKGEALDAAFAKLAEVVEQQPIHAHDQGMTERTIGNVLELVGDAPENHDFSVSVSGSCWERDGVFGGVNISVNAGHCYVPPAA